MNFEIQENQGIDLVKLGMRYDEIRHNLNCGFSTTSRQEAKTYMYEVNPEPIINPSGPQKDCFCEIGLVAYYNISGICHGMRFVEPARPTFRGRSLLWHEDDEYKIEYSVGSIQVWLDSLGGDCKIQGEWVISYQFGIELECFIPGEYEYIKYSHAKAVTVFSDGYHNDVR